MSLQGSHRPELGPGKGRSRSPEGSLMGSVRSLAAGALLLADRAYLVGILSKVVRSVLHAELVGDADRHVSSLELFDLCHRVLLDKVIDFHVTAANSHHYLVALADPDVDAL